MPALPAISPETTGRVYQSYPENDNDGVDLSGVDMTYIGIRDGLWAKWNKQLWRKEESTLRNLNRNMSIYSSFVDELINVLLIKSNLHSNRPSVAIYS